MAGPTNIAAIVAEGMCIGCGVCVGVCPRPTATMNMSAAGLWEPRFSGVSCPASCGRCYAVCPFSEKTLTETEIGSALFAHNPGVARNDLLGYWITCLVGTHPEEPVRITAASGGIVTMILESALANGLVQAVACVGPYRPETQDFSIQLVENPEDVRRCASSKYFPVHYADVLKQISRERRPVAIVALPCQVKALRMAAQVDLRLKQALVLIVALTCGQMKTAWFTRRLACTYAGTDNLTDVQYRVKRVDASAYDYSFRFTRADADDGGEATVPFHIIGPLWESRWCGAYPCCFCDDIFGECADVSVMDAWHLPYSKDGRGTSLVVVRSTNAEDLLADARQSGTLHTVDPAVVKDSQAGAALDKRAGVAFRARLANRLGLPGRERRVSASTVGIAQQLVWIGAYLSAASGRASERLWRAKFMATGSVLFMGLGRMVSRTIILLRRPKRGAS